MPDDETPQSFGLRPGLSRGVQFVIVAVLALAVGVGVIGVPILAQRLAAGKEVAQPPRPEAASGSFRPTEAQWSGFKLEPVTTRVFRPVQVTEGNIAIDDDLTTPVFSPYSGRASNLLTRPE
jgi:cobalt-zinc-cadmium efflux system membrane fusion protein